MIDDRLEFSFGRASAKNTTFGKWMKDYFGSPKIDKIFVNKPVVVVLWTDGTRTKSTCDANDIFDPFVGVSVCFAKKMVGKDKLNRIIRKAMR
jgi:hypothetical protein